MNDSCNIFISKNVVFILMTAEAWKCFRCNLTFRNEELARLHKDISKHSVSEIKLVTA